MDKIQGIQIKCEVCYGYIDYNCTFKINKMATKPLNTAKITSPYGYRINPITKNKEFHGGIDLAPTEPEEHVKTAYGCKIVTKGWSDTFGNRVWVSNVDGEAKGLYTVYPHMRELFDNYKVGDVIPEGFELGIVGSTGLSTNVHLHFEHRTTPDISGSPVEPTEIENLYK